MALPREGSLPLISGIMPLLHQASKTYHTSIAFIYKVGGKNSL